MAHASLAHKWGVGTHLSLPQIFHEINTDFNFIISDFIFSISRSLVNIHDNMTYSGLRWN